MRTRQRKSNMLYTSILKHGLTQPAIEVDNAHGSIAVLGDSLQGVCAWYAFELETTPAQFDRILSASQNLAIGSVSQNQEVWFDGCRNQVMFRNNSQHCAQVTIYKCYPRMDITTAHSVSGANPVTLQQGFSATAQENKAGFATFYNDYNSTPYMSPNWCSLFKVKPFRNKFLQPGESLMLNHKRSLGFLIKKSSAGLTTTDSFAGAYNHMRKNGPIYLVRVRGTVVHDESLLAYPLSVNSDMHVTTGGFSVDWVQSSKLDYRAPFIAPTRVQGTYTRLPSAITRVNTVQYTTETPLEQIAGA